MNAKTLFDVIRDIKFKAGGANALTDAEVARVNAALAGDASAVALHADAPDAELVAQLKIDEGLRLTSYMDTVGVWTVGYGHAHVAPGTVWTHEQAEAQLLKDVAVHNAELELELRWVVNLDPVRRRVLQNMAFNLGVGNAARGTGLLGFKNTLEFVRTGQFAKAAAGMRASKWARQVGARAERLAKQMETGQ